MVSRDARVAEFLIRPSESITSGESPTNKCLMSIMLLPAIQCLLTAYCRPLRFFRTGPGLGTRRGLITSDLARPGPRGKGHIPGLSFPGPFSSVC